MVEFGEQLRRAREEKGMTQQSLAELLYVTRQAVSRWECGDRYPDLLTTKKISLLLDVSLDDLLSGKEMKKEVERNPVIENKAANNIMIMFYAFVVVSFIISVVDIILRFPFQSEAIGYSDIQLIVIHVLGLLIQITFFSYGLFQAVRGTLSPKRMGVVIMAFFGAMCITTTGNYSNLSAGQVAAVGVTLIVPCVLGAIASFFYYIRNDKNKIIPGLIYVVSIWGIFLIIISNIQMFRSGQFLSMNSTINLVLKIAIYGLVLYQTYILGIKRKNAVEICEAEGKA